MSKVISMTANLDGREVIINIFAKDIDIVSRDNVYSFNVIKNFEKLEDIEYAGMHDE
jgi:hypothetical protein